MTLETGFVTQNEGVMDPFFKGHGDSRSVSECVLADYPCCLEV